MSDRPMTLREFIDLAKTAGIEDDAAVFFSRDEQERFPDVPAKAKRSYCKVGDAFLPWIDSVAPHLSGGQ